jgi:hypothetical protein
MKNFIKILFQDKQDFIPSYKIKTVIPLVQQNTEDRLILFTVTKYGDYYTGVLQNDNVVNIQISKNSKTGIFSSKEELIQNGLEFYKTYLKPSGWDIIPEIKIKTYSK